MQSLPHFIASNPNWGEALSVHLGSTIQIYLLSSEEFAQDWGLCLKEAFLAAQKELIEFAAREGRSRFHADSVLTHITCGPQLHSHSKVDESNLGKSTFGHASSQWQGFNLEASGAAGSVLIFEARLVKNTRRTM